MSLLELAERVEGATGPDQELDAQIWWECGDGKRLCPNDSSAGQAVRRYFGADFDEDGNFRPETTATYRGLAYTSSLDAAMMLIPENYTVHLTFSGCNHFRPEATLWLHGTLSGPGDIQAEAATTALAVTAACLRARAASGIEAASADETRSGSAVGESPARSEAKGDAQ